MSRALPLGQDEGPASSKDRAFYSDEEDENNKAKNESAGLSEYSMEADHRLLLTATAPLLNSRNAGVRPRAQSPSPPRALRTLPCAPCPTRRALRALPCAPCPAVC